MSLKRLCVEAFAAALVWAPVPAAFGRVASDQINDDHTTSTPLIHYALN